MHTEGHLISVAKKLPLNLLDAPSPSLIPN
jgi:hypothetical protein